MLEDSEKQWFPPSSSLSVSATSASSSARSASLPQIVPPASMSWATLKSKIQHKGFAQSLANCDRTPFGPKVQDRLQPIVSKVNLMAHSEPEIFSALQYATANAKGKGKLAAISVLFKWLTVNYEYKSSWIRLKGGQEISPGHLEGLVKACTTQLDTANHLDLVAMKMRIVHSGTPRMEESSTCR